MKINQLKSGVILSYITMVASSVIQLAYTPILLRYLGQNEYGVYQLVASLVSYLSVLNFGLSGAYVRFFARYKVKNQEKEIQKLNGAFLIMFSIAAIICLIIGAILYFKINVIFKSKLSVYEIDTAKILMLILVVNMSITLLSTVVDCYIIANEFYFFQKMVSLIKVIAIPLFTLPLLFIGEKSIAVVAINLIVTFIAFFVSLYYAVIRKKMRFKIIGIDKKILVEIYSFSFFIFLNIIVDQINWNTDKVIIGVVGGAASVAVYGIAAQINNIYTSLSSSISSVFAPRINRMVAQDSDGREINELFIRVGRIQFIVLAYIMLNVIFLGREFILAWAGKNYGASYYCLLLLCIPATIPLVQSLGIEIQRAKNKHQFRSIIYLIMAVINVGVSIPLTIHFGVVGAALGTSISLFFCNGLIMNVFYYKSLQINIPMFWKNITMQCRGLIIPIMVVLLLKAFIVIDTVFLFIVFAVILFIIYFVSMWFFGMNSNEQELIRSFLKKFRK